MGVWTNVKGMAIMKDVPEEHCAEIIRNLRDMAIPEKYYGLQFMGTTANSGRVAKKHICINVIGDLEGFTLTRDLSEWLKTIFKDILINSFIIEIECPYYECREADRYILIK